MKKLFVLAIAGSIAYHASAQEHHHEATDTATRTTEQDAMMQDGMLMRAFTDQMVQCASTLLQKEERC